MIHFANIFKSIISIMAAALKHRVMACKNLMIHLGSDDGMSREDVAAFLIKKAVSLKLILRN